ncbi:MAG: hypothetical protein M1115_08705 [Actinobacteria bacterium]|nr:hypothetical protein [Actinomycetota bacterium]
MIRRKHQAANPTTNGDVRLSVGSPSPSRKWEQLEHPYAGRTAVLATKHEKLPLIGPPLLATIGLQVQTVPVDTDSLGTFTGDIPRQWPPLETAIAKARLGMNVARQALGLASEGSIGPDPTIPFVITDREIVVLVDDDNGIVVWESQHSSDIVAAATKVSTDDDLRPFLSKACFPDHQLIVRPSSGALHPIHKGISSIDQLTAAVTECATVANDSLALVETDLRAHVCPSRRAIIAAASVRLASRIASRCPSCGSPGWGRIDVQLGVPCAWCGTEIARPRAEIDGCPTCEHRETRPVISPEVQADPGECPYCNP